MEMKINDYLQLSEDYRRIEQALYYLEEHAEQQPSLKDVAESLGLSEYHFQRLFARWVGISPKRFLQFLTKERAMQMLQQSENVLDVAYASGLSGPGRLHDLLVTCEGVTPGEVKRQGEGLEILYGYHPSPFGEILLAITPRGICHLAFVEDGDRDGALAELKEHWQNASLRASPADTEPFVQSIFPLLQGQVATPLHLYLRGTNFQMKVWEALLRIPPGQVVSYERLAARIGAPKAVRAVSNAVARNPVPVIIPCHRVIRKMGEFGGYHYGTVRKKALLGWEMAYTGNLPV